MLTKEPFDRTEDGKTVVAYRITNKSGAYAEILDYGALIRALCVPDRDGRLTDVVLGFDTIAAYRKHASSCFGATIGRYANRIRGARFSLNGAEYQLIPNDGENHLHGGLSGFHTRLWELRHEDTSSVTLRYRSADQEEGYPGTLTVDVTYTFEEDNTLRIVYEASSDRDTVFSPSNHTYFNLSGHGTGMIDEHRIRIPADCFLPCDSDCMVLGEIASVRGETDLRAWKRIGDGFFAEKEDPDLTAGHGYDHTYLVSDAVSEKMIPAAEAYSPETGIRLRVATTMPGIQFYTGNFIASGARGKQRTAYGPRTAFCLETQFYPDAPNHPEWPSPVLRAGTKCHYETAYSFDTPPEIVILDGHTTNPGDLSWEPLAGFGPLLVYERTAPQEIVSRARNAEIVITNKAVLTAEILDKLPKLRYVGLLSTGANSVDTEICKVRGITVCNAPGYSTEDVAQMTFSLLLELCFRVADHSRRVHEGAWESAKDFCFWDAPLSELSGKTIGIIGFGAIGRRVCEIAQAFHMKVLVYSRTLKPLPEGVHWCNFPELLQQSDVVTLHCPLTAQNEKMISESALRRMKPSAFLINTARGGLIDEKALAEALNQDRLAGAALDVLSAEPPLPDNPMLTAKNCLITPHISWAAREARVRLIRLVADNLANYLRGNPHNRIV